jgi:ABC-2 type transport system ATP-binding protein
LNGLKALWKPEYKTVTAVDNISFNVNQGEIVAFIGPNGAGKSTTIKMLTGILFPTSGVIQVLGFNPQRQRQKLAYSIGSVFGQKPQLWYHLAPQDTYDLFSRIYELNQDDYKARLKYLVDAFEIGDLLQTPVRKLSLGQRMRCEIVASLLHRPKIIFLDEPTIGLDVIAKQRIREVIKHLNETEQVTIFLTSHDAGDVEALAQRTIVINHGRVLFDDTTEKFKQEYIKTKRIELVVENGGMDFEFPDGRITQKTNFNIQIELPTGYAIDKLLSHAMANYKIKDVNINDPEMEEIIADIYQHKKS